jgi:hypothetical protein
MYPDHSCEFPCATVGISQIKIHPKYTNDQLTFDSKNKRVTSVAFIEES